MPGGEADARPLRRARAARAVRARQPGRARCSSPAASSPSSRPWATASTCASGSASDGRDAGSAIAFGLGPAARPLRRPGPLRRRLPAAGEPLERHGLAAARRPARLRRAPSASRSCATWLAGSVAGRRGGVDARGARRSSRSSSSARRGVGSGSLLESQTFRALLAEPRARRARRRSRAPAAPVAARRRHAGRRRRQLAGRPGEVVEREDEPGELARLCVAPPPSEDRAHGPSDSRRQARHPARPINRRKARVHLEHGSARAPSAISDLVDELIAEVEAYNPDVDRDLLRARVRRSPSAPTTARCAARARSSSTTRGASRRSAPSCSSTSRRSPRRSCTTSSRTPTTDIDELRAEFGDEIAQLVEGVTKLTRIQFQSREQAEAENYRKMIVAMAQDVRVILIKLADRLHNMRTIEYLGKQKQVQKATRDARGLRAARAPPRHPRAQVGARGSRVPDAAPAQVRGDQGDGRRAPRRPRGARREAARGARGASSTRSTSRPRSPAARSTSTRSTTRWPRRAASSTRSTT